MRASLITPHRAPCEICQKETFHEQLFSKWGYPIYCCQTCRLVWTPSPSEGELAQLYGPLYFEGGYRDGYESYERVEPTLRRHFAALAKQLFALTGRGRLLEIGCAYGYFLVEAQPYFEVEGIERSEDAVERCRNLGLKVQRATLAEAILQPAYFDVVVLFDTLEHLPHPALALRKIFSSLRPGGTLLLTTGDIGSLSARLFGRFWRLMTPPQHLFFFSSTTLTMLLKRSGFDDVKIRYPWKIVPASLIIYQVLRRMGWPAPRAPWLARLGIPANLFDVMQVTARRAKA